MNVLNTCLLVVGLLVLILGLLSGLLKRRGISDRLVALGVGVALGPEVLNVLNPADWGDQHLVLEQAARLTLGIGLMGVALRIPFGFTRKSWKSIGLLLIGGMVGMWIISSVLLWAFLGLGVWAALLVGAVVTPTDPVAASVIVTGEVAEKNLPDRLRHLISAESGLNDGLAYLFVLLPIFFLDRAKDEPLLDWLTRGLLWDVGVAVLVGGVLGYVTGRLLEWAEERNYIERASFLAITLALALVALGAVKLIGSDGLLAVFVAGMAFDSVVKVEERAEEEQVVAALDRFLTLPIFTLLGLTLPWADWRELGWTGPGLCLAILLLRRLPVLLLLTPVVPALKDRRDSLYLGWFGPIGVAALFYASLAVKRTEVHEAWVVASLLITASIVVHGLTATPLTRLYGAQGKSAESQ